jgi:hypothetical protein
MKRFLWCVALLLLAPVAMAQTTTNTLSPAQCAAFKADIQADATLTLAALNRQDELIVPPYNQQASPAYYVWKSAVSRTEMLYTKSMDNTTFDVSGNGFVLKTTQELLLFESLFDPLTKLTNPMNPLIITSFQVAMAGTGIAATNRTHMAAIVKRLATRAEKLFADTTAGNGAKATPASMTFEGAITTNHVACALNLP